MLPIVIDIEASGFGRKSYPIEVGVALPDETTHCFLLAPPQVWTYWDEQAEAVHGISREILEQHGHPLEDVAWRLNELLSNKVIYSDAWSFDMSWLGKLYDVVNMPQTFRIASLYELMTEQQLAGWDELKEKAMSRLQLQRHRASGDARILQESYRLASELAA